MVSATETADLTEQLAAAHGFSMDDLAANRAGRVTPDQARRMRHILRRRNRNLWRFIPVCLFAAVLVVVLYPSEVIWAAVFVLLAGLLAAFALIRTPALADLEGEEVEVLQGAVRTTWNTTLDVEDRQTTHRYYLVGDRRVEVGITIAKNDPIAFGEWYRLYVMARYGWLLSIEPVPGPAPSSDEAAFLASLAGRWQPANARPGMPSQIDIAPDGTVTATAGGQSITGKLLIEDREHIRIVAGSKTMEWHVELQGDRLLVKLPLHGHLDFERIAPR